MVREAYNKKTADKNKCLLIHLAAATICADTACENKEPYSTVAIPRIMARAIALRRAQYGQAKACVASPVAPSKNEPLAVSELGPHVRDVVNINCDRDNRALM